MRAVLVALAVAGLAACGGGGGSTVTSPPPGGNNNPPPSSNSITVSNNAFSPANKSIAPGTTVNWSWNTCTGDAYSGQTCVSHSVTFDDGQSSPTQDQGAYSRTFTAAGTYNYHCAVHGTAMAGSIAVQ